MKVRDLQHELLPRATPEDQSRQQAVVALRRLLNTRVRPGNVDRYGEEGAPAFAADHGRAPRSPAEMRAAFFRSPRYRFWSAANRSAQEMLWVAVGEPAYRERERLGEAAIRLGDAPGNRGSLKLDPQLDPSPEVAELDIHLQPGGYALDRGADDVIAGALYETGGNVFSFGQGAGLSDSKAAVAIRLLQGRFSDLTPRRILDIGCSAGAASAAYAAAFPEAEVHAIDIGAGMLRYAHARAESLGVAVHFHQMDASAMGFEDGGFDLVVSHNLLHEIGEAKRRAMIAEAVRVLRPGGVALHQDVAIRSQPSPVHAVERDWDRHFNGERHWAAYAEADLVADMTAAGLPRDVVEEHDLPAMHGALRWYAVSGRKPG